MSGATNGGESIRLVTPLIRSRWIQKSCAAGFRSTGSFFGPDAVHTKENATFTSEHPYRSIPSGMAPKVLIVAVSVLLGLAAPQRAQAQASRTVTVTVSTPVFTTPSCIGEMVIFNNGVAVTIERTTFDSSSGSHTKNQMKVLGKGVGVVTGATYKYYTVSNTESEITNPPGTVTDTLTSGTNITGQGPANNMVLHVTSKMTTNDLGVTTVDFVQINFECPSDGGTISVP